MSEFQRFKKLYQGNKFDTLLQQRNSVRWLKIFSISRKNLLVKFCRAAGIKCQKTAGVDAISEHIYNSQHGQLLDNFILQEYRAARTRRLADELALVSELYKVRTFDWGGLYQNNLEKTIINNYVKKICAFDDLNKKIETEIHESMRNYVQASWYNHWTSILIEDIIKDHKKVIPVIGLKKKIDFFISDIPFDLKVTYFPEGFMSKRRKADGLRTELQVMKQFATTLNLRYDTSQKDKILFSELLARISESTNSRAQQFATKFKKERWSIIKQALEKPQELITWLYENQGERRFDAANRLFLILIDKKNLEESWKMKRNIDLLRNTINRHLEKFDASNTARLRIKFNWEAKQYTTMSDVIFVVK